MKKRWIILGLAAVVLTAGCAHNTIPVPEEPQTEQTETVNKAETDFYTVELAKDWQWEIQRYGEDIPSGDVVFYDEEHQVSGGGAIVMAANDSLSDLPEQIRVLREERTEEGWIIGKLEVVGNAAGGDTSSEYHVLIPLNDDRQMHEYIDLHLDGQRYDQEALSQLAETVVLRNQQLFGFVRQMADGQLAFVQGEWVDGSDTTKQQELGVTENELSRGFAIVPVGEVQTLPVATDVQYYLVDTIDQLFKEVTADVFLQNLQAHPEEVYDVTLKDGAVVTIEERVL